MSMKDVGVCIPLLLFLVLLPPTSGQLDPNYYAFSCPPVQQIVNQWLVANVFADNTGPAALIRLVFHDCVVGGCEGSVLLDSQFGIQSELESDSNFGIRDLEFIDSIKNALEMACPGVVSCADILALAARDCVSLTGGPMIDIPLGRKDATTASNFQADQDLPSTAISIPDFLSLFGQMGMTASEAVASLGAHTLGVGHCVNVVSRLYPQQDPALSPILAGQLIDQCPTPNSNFINNNTVLDNDATNFNFDNQYFVDIQAGRGLFKIDSNIALNPTTAPIVARFAADQNEFFQEFASAFVKLTSFRTLGEGEGEVRFNCRLVN